MKTRFLLLSFIFVLFTVGCQKPPLPQESVWNGNLTLAEGKPLPFQMVLNFKAAPASGYFLVSNEQIPIPEVYQRGDSVILAISEYGAAIQCVWRDSKLTGKFLRFRADTSSLAFEATPANPTASTPTKPSKAMEVPLVGKFQVYFHNDNVIDSLTSAKFWAKGDSIFGTFVAPDGDYGLMVGKQEGDHVQLNRFTGWQANILDLKRETGNWSGKYYARSNPPTAFTLEPRIELPKEIPSTKQARMKDPKKSFVFSGVTITGDTLTNLDKRFKGKVLIVDIMGTWCHNCMDEAPLLQQLYKEFNEEGLEIIDLSFELKNDPALARKNLMLYQERYGINFPLLFCGTTEEENVKARLRSQVDNFFAYPTTFFIDRKGIVQHIHVGFKGPGTGDEYQQEIQTFYDIVKKMVAKK